MLTFARGGQGRGIARDSGQLYQRSGDLCIEANTRLPQEHLAALQRALEAEESELGREVIERLLENAEVARERCIAFCQDTDMLCSSSSWGMK